MKPGPRLTALATATCLGLMALVSGSAQPSAAASVKVRVVGIDRNGQQVKVDATIYSTNDPPVFLQNGRAVRVPVGRHWVGASVPTHGPNNTVVSETLVMRRVTITRSETVRLDARPGKLVRFALDVPGATDTSDDAQACVGGRFVPGGGVGASSDPGTLYVVPVRSRDMLFGYGSSWQGTSAGYHIAGQSRGGIPATPAYRARLSGMAKLALVVRNGTTALPYNNPILEFNKPCGDWQGLGLNPANGATLTEYVTAGSWTTALYSDRGFWQNTRRLGAGRSYLDIFGGAVWGPGKEAPRSGGGRISFYPDSPFTDPAQPVSNECCDESSITLSKGGHVLKRQVLDQYLKNRLFSAKAPTAGWYTLHIKAWRWTPGAVIPKGLLSRWETVTWRFYTAPRSIPVGFEHEVPAEVARIWAGGLNIDNQASADSTTTLHVHVLRTHDRGIPRAPRYRLKTVRVQASFDGGKTWHTLRLTGRGASWIATVQNPAAGYVALRTLVTDARGDSSAQTIYQAYAVG